MYRISMAQAGGEWVLVSAKRRTRKASGTRPHPTHSTYAHTHAHGKKASVSAATVEPFDRDARVSETKQCSIQSRVEGIAAALFAQAVRDPTSLVGAALCAASDHLGWSDSELPRRHLHIVSYGLGSFCSSSNAVHQLAFVHALVQAAKHQYADVETMLEIFDPVMNASDREIAAALGITSIDENESGKRVAPTPTVFFMPHCGHALYQNVIAANVAAETLQNTLIIGNSFEAYSDRLIDAAARKASVLLGVLPFVRESPLPLGLLSSHDEFSLYESAFNDLSIHSFSREQADAVCASVTLQAVITGLVESAASSTVASAIDRELIA